MRRLWSRLKFTLRLYSGLYLDVRRGRAAGALQESQGLVTSLRGRHLFHSIHTLLFKKNHIYYHLQQRLSPTRSEECELMVHESF